MFNRFKCDKHIYELVDVKHICGELGGYYWKYKVSCVKCRKKSWLELEELKMKYKLGFIDIDDETAKIIFK